MKCPVQAGQPCDACIELANLDATPITSQNFLDLIQKRQRNKTNINLSHDPLVSRLPNEVISLIFIFLHKINVPGKIKPDDVSFWRLDHLLWTPTLLSRVCGTWRTIVLTTPQLWTNLMLNVWIMSRKLELLKEFLSRSGSLPLSLVLYGINNPKGDPGPITSVLRSHSARWGSLDISRAPGAIIYKLLHNLDNMPTSDLLHLYMRFFDPQRTFLPKPLRPRHLSFLSFAATGDEISKIPLRILQWDNITSLDLRYLSINTLCNLVQQTPQLMTCTVLHLTTSSSTVLRPTPEAPAITVPFLKHLHITFKDNDSLLFRYLTLPALTHLKCHFGEDRSFWDSESDIPLQDMINFVGRSRLDPKSLQTFDLRYTIYTMNYDARFTELTTITHIYILISHLEQAADLTDSYLSKLSDISSFPRLREFHIRTPKMSPSSWRSLCNIFRGGFLPLSNDSIHATDSLTPALQDPSIPQRFHRRPLEKVFVEVSTVTGYAEIPHQEYLTLQDVQRAGVVDLLLKAGDGVNLLEMVAEHYETVS